jgi:hypothetical protein
MLDVKRAVNDESNALGRHPCGGDRAHDVDGVGITASVTHIRRAKYPALRIAAPSSLTSRVGVWTGPMISK